MQTNPNQPDTESNYSLHQTSVFGGSAQPVVCDPRLLKIYPVEAGARLLPISGEAAVLGRERTCEFVVDYQSVSRRHAMIVQRGNDFYIEDLSSTNGTWVNEIKVNSQRLTSGDRIRIGTCIFKFLNADNVEAKYHESIYEMMTHDALTGAWNKRYLFDVLDREINQHLRTKQPLSLLMLDLDFFKAINDKHGHVVGDEVLAEFGKRMLNCVRGSDLFARYGGEEFAIVLVNSSRESALEAAERYHETVQSKLFETSVGSIACTFSGGIAVWTHENPISRAEFIAEADEKLYQAKTEGRNRIGY